MPSPSTTATVAPTPAARVLLTSLLLSLTGCGDPPSGLYASPDGLGSLEFKGRRVFVTSATGTTFAAEYQRRGDRIILSPSGGSRVFTLDDDTILAGDGVVFVKAD